MVIRFVPNKKNNHKVVEEQAVWRGTNCYVKISLINLKGFNNLHDSAVP